MSAFGGLVLTTKGRNLQAKAQAGAQLNFTRIGVGDGDLAGSSILELNALKHEVKTLDITKLKPLTGGKAAVGGMLSNVGLLSGFYWRELGLFAQDPDIGEILYCYGNSGTNAEYIPADGGPDVLEKSIDIISIVGDAANVTATIEQSMVFATVGELNALTTEVATKETPAGAQTKATAAETAAKAYADLIVAALVDSSPTALNTLNELAAALGDDPNFATTVLNQIATKADSSALTSHVADYTLQIPFGGTTTNVDNAYSTATPAIEALNAGMAIAVKINTDSTGAATLNWDGKGAKAIKKANGTDVTNLKNGGIYTLRYDGTNFTLQGEGGEYGTVTPDKVVKGVTFGTENGVSTGSLKLGIDYYGSPIFDGTFPGGTINLNGKFYYQDYCSFVQTFREFDLSTGVTTGYAFPVTFNSLWLISAWKNYAIVGVYRNDNYDYANSWLLFFNTDTKAWTIKKTGSPQYIDSNNRGYTISQSVVDETTDILYFVSSNYWTKNESGSSSGSCYDLKSIQLSDGDMTSTLYTNITPTSGDLASLIRYPGYQLVARLIDGSIYFYGGDTNSSLFWKYDTTTNIVSLLATVPGANQMFALLSDKILIMSTTQANYLYYNQVTFAWTIQTDDGGFYNLDGTVLKKFKKLLFDVYYGQLIFDQHSEDVYLFRWYVEAISANSGSYVYIKEPAVFKIM